jgi:hypothetical protein
MKAKAVGREEALGSIVNGVIEYARQRVASLALLQEQLLRRLSCSSVRYRPYVRVTDGPHQGKFGSLVSLLSAETEPIFLVELEDGGDVEIGQSRLCFISHDN